MSIDPNAPILPDEDLPPIVTAPPRRTVKKGRLILAVVAFVLVVGFILRQAGDATVYFRTVDEAVAEKADLGTDRFRIEGVVAAGSIVQSADALRFSIHGEGGATAAIVHRGGQPTGLFRDDIPVVLEGRWAADGTHYESDRVIVKHSETYRMENPERVEQYPPSTVAS